MWLHGGLLATVTCYSSVSKCSGAPPAEFQEAVEIQCRVALWDRVEEEMKWPNLCPQRTVQKSKTILRHHCDSQFSGGLVKVDFWTSP